MSFGSFLRGIAAQVNPFDNGKTYGTFNPPQKKKQDDQNQFGAPSPLLARNNQNNTQPQIKTQTPQNLFAGLNNDMRLPGAPQNNLNVAPNTNLKVSTAPPAGTIIQPNGQPTQPPQNTPPPPQPHGFWHSVGQGFKTAGQTAAATVANVPEVGLAAARAGTGIVQGVTQLPHIVTAAAATGTQKLNQIAPNSFTHAINTGAQGANTGINAVTKVVNKPINLVNRTLDNAAAGYANHVPPAAGGLNVYKTEQLPLNALAGLVTLGGSTAAEGANAAGEAGQSGRIGSVINRFQGLLNKPLTSNADNAVSRTAQVVSNKTAPVVQALNTPLSSVRSGVNGVRNLPVFSRNVNVPALEAGVDAGETGNVLASPQLNSNPQPPTKIPVSQVSGKVPIPVSTPRPGEIIRELGGDSLNVRQIPTPQEAAAQRATSRFEAQAPGRPDPSVEGILPRSPTQPYQLTPGAAKGAQGDVVKQYADFLRGLGEGNGTQLVPDGEAYGSGVKRTSNNYRAPGVGSARMTKQDWIDQAQKELEAGQAETGHQQAFNDASNPEVQSLLTKGDTTQEAPVGKPIAVKEVKGIPVVDMTDKTNVPTNLPETPGAVRATTQAAPANEKAAAVAAQPLPAAPLPKVGAIMPDGTKVTKRMIQAARNNRNNVKKMAKVKAETQAVIDNGAGREAGTVLHLPDQGVHAKLTPDQAAILADETKQIPFTANDRPHLTAGSQVLKNTREVSQAEIAKMSPNAAKALENAGGVKPHASDNPGFVSTGEYRQGAQGNVTESASKAAEATQGAHDIANVSVQDVLNKARQEVTENGVVSPETTRNLKAIRDSGNFSRTSPEFKAVTDEYKNAISHHARALSMTDRTARTTASGDQLTNRFITKLTSFTDDSGKITNAHIQQVTDAENAFTQARDRATALGEQFKSTGDPTSFKAWKSAQQAAEQADRQAKITEYLVSKDALKGNKNFEATKAVQEAEKNAGVYSMDSIDSNMLSGTGTMVRNYINTLFPRVENKLFGRASSLAVRKLAPIGGSSGRGARIGSQIGKDMFKADAAARKEGGVGIIRRTVTSGNTIGEKNIEATTYSKAFSHYKQILKDEGYKGSELNNRAEFNVRTDPDGLVQQYRRDTLQANALSSLTHTKKIENVLADGVQRTLANAGFGSKGQTAGRFGAKAITRVGLGFPTVIARSLAEGFKRLTLGLPEVGWSTAKFIKTGNTEQFAGELSKAIQHAGTGGSLLMLGSALGKAGVISGAYPTDPAERARWTAEGRQENSIKIGGQWFNIPGYLGGFALPLMLGATAGSGNLRDEATLKNAWSTILSSSPVDNIQSTLNVLTGGSSAAQGKNAATSLVRSATPAGSFVAELAKLTDRTQNDTTTKDSLHNILDSIAGGIPGLNNKVNTVDKTDAYGNVLKNPNPAATVLGAQGVEQKQGSQDVQKQQSASDQTLSELQSYGVLNNKNLMQLVDPKLAKELGNGQKLTPQDVAKVQKAVTKGVSASEDNNWRQNGDYSTDKAALQAKLQILNADPTSKPSEKQQYQVQIKRDDVLQSNGIPYDALKQYQSTSLSDWRSMGDSTSGSYDPDTYQKLWAIDQLMAKSGASYKTSDPSKQKFSAKQPGSGRGSRGGSPVNGDFGKLSAGDFAPKVQQYQTINQQAGNIPIISIQHPNIVHNISSSG